MRLLPLAAWAATTGCWYAALCWMTANRAKRLWVVAALVAALWLLSAMGSGTVVRKPW